MTLRLEKIRTALSNGHCWPLMRRHLRVLTKAELLEAEQLERLGKRRENMLRAIHAERARRAGKSRPPSEMKVEANR